MGLGRSAAVVIGSFPLGESDRVVTFFSRDFGRLRGVAKAARRLKSRFGGSLELFTLGQLVFFDTGRSELVRVDHFDVTRPFASVREDLGRLGEVGGPRMAVTYRGRAVLDLPLVILHTAWMSLEAVMEARNVVEAGAP